MFNFLFNIVILLLVVLVTVFSFKVYFNTMSFNKVSELDAEKLQEAILIQGNKSDLINVKVQLSDDFNRSHMNRLFKITKEILLMQKLIFDK